MTSYTKTRRTMANPNRPSRERLFALNIVGASARAAAGSALRAGAAVTASDIFGDEDLRAVARYVEPVGKYPRSFAGALRGMPSAPFIYTGGLENHPDLVDALARIRTLWGNPGRVLRRARDPFLVASVLRSAGLLVPEMRRSDDPPPRLSGWLEKPLAGAGGRGIARATRRDGAGRGRPFYYQRLVPGPSYSALFAAGPRGARLLGATRQLVGAPWLHASPYAWCGSIGPASLPGDATASLRAAGEALAASLDLRGLFGLDFILEDGQPRPVDLNPRYPASAEILEHALGFSAVAVHCQAFPRGLPPGTVSRGTKRCAGILGKAVIFAPRRLVLAVDIAGPGRFDPWRLPALADIPARGRCIARGHPLLTVFARARSEEGCARALERAAAKALRHFQAAPAESYYRAR